MIRFFYDLEDRFAALADERRGSVCGMAAVWLRDLFAYLGDAVRTRPNPGPSRSSGKVPIVRD